MYWFAIASLIPTTAILAANLLGGLWSWAALVSVTIFVVLADRVDQKSLNPREDDKAVAFARRLGRGLALVHFVVLGTGIRAIALSPELDHFQALALGVALGMYMGQVSNSNAHELIHAPGRWMRFLGGMVYVSMLFGHHASAHMKVHHVHVATSRDPNSARLGQGFYDFWPRAWVGSFIAGLKAETTTRQSRGVHPYVIYVGGAVLFVLLSWGIAGLTGVAVYLALAGYAQMQLLLADYVQHYGLCRTVGNNGRIEPAGPQHSWNARQWYSSAMMLNAPRHSDHHLHPLRRFPALRLDPDTMPLLPHSLPVMAAIALVPPVWHRVMDPKVAQWQACAGVDRNDLAMFPHARNLDDSPDLDGSAGNTGNGPDTADGRRF